MDPTAAAWLSGFIDGEGYVGLHAMHLPKKTYWQALVQVKHTHRPTVDHAVGLLSQLGINSPVSTTVRSERQKDAWNFNVTGMGNVLTLADAIERYSVTKVEQWAVVREWCELRLVNRSTYSGRELELAAIGDVMNKRGKT